jgi:hypothetical protein
MKRWLTLLSILTLMGSGALNAQTLGTESDEETPPWYQVELFVFANKGADLNAEYWPVVSRPVGSDIAIELQSESDENTVSGLTETHDSNAFRLLSADENNLKADEKLSQIRGYRPLLTAAWRQPLLPRDKTLPIRLVAGNRFDDGRFELEGEISLDIARYLHLRTNLFFTRPVPDNGVLRRAPVSKEDAGAPSTPQETAAAYTPADLYSPNLLTVQMQQGRRMRGEEIHYLDHPLFGLIIRLTLVQPNP